MHHAGGPTCAKQEEHCVPTKGNCAPSKRELPYHVPWIMQEIMVHYAGDSYHTGEGTEHAGQISSSSISEREQIGDTALPAIISYKSSW